MALDKPVNNEPTKEDVLASLTNYGRFKCLSEQLRNDPEVALEAIKRSSCSFEDVSDRLKNDEQFAIAAVSINSFLLKRLPDHFKKNPNVVFAAVAKPIIPCYGGHGQHPQYIDEWEHVDNTLKNDEAFRKRVRKAILPSVLNGISMQVFGGFITVIGIASVALVLATINLSTLGMAGILIAGAATLAIGATFFGKGHFQKEKERLTDDAMRQHGSSDSMAV